MKQSFRSRTIPSACVQPPCPWDVAAFLKSGQADEIESLREAARFYRGELLAEFGSRDEGFEGWLSIEREQLARRQSAFWKNWLAGKRQRETGGCPEARVARSRTRSLAAPADAQPVQPREKGAGPQADRRFEELLLNELGVDPRWRHNGLPARSPKVAQPNPAAASRFRQTTATNPLSPYCRSATSAAILSRIILPTA